MATSTSSQEKPVSDSHNSPANDTLQSCSVSTEPVMIVTQAGADLLQILAKQVEYYFSTTNLATDTYLSTLRSLNDGYVPVSIIANFAKVRSLVPYDALNAVHQASEDYSDLLEVVFINAETGKRIATSEIESSSATLVAAVGPISGEPIPSSQMKLTSTPVSSPISSVVSSTPVQNTIVLREVPQGIQEAQVRRLFTFEKCPTIQEVHRDVASCWFVTLDTSSRDVMVDVMFALRGKKFESGEPVMARLKAAVVANRDATSNVAYYLGGNHMMAQQADTSGRKKKKNNNKSRSNRSSNAQNKNVNGKKANGSRQNNGGKQNKANGQNPKQKQGSKSNQNRTAPTRSAPSLGEEQFPALPSDDHLSISEKFEVEKVPEHDELGKKNSGASDSSSTATTSTASSKSPQPHIVMGGYAAALMKTATQQQVEKSQKTSTRIKQADEKATNKNAKNAKPKELLQTDTATEKSAPVAVNVHPPSWGRGTFADVLRSKEASIALART